MAAAAPPESPYFELPQEGPTPTKVVNPINAPPRRPLVSGTTTALLQRMTQQAQQHAHLLAQRQAQLQELARQARQWPPPPSAAVSVEPRQQSCITQERTISALNREIASLRLQLHKQQDEFVFLNEQQRREIDQLKKAHNDADQQVIVLQRSLAQAQQAQQQQQIIRPPAPPAREEKMVALLKKQLNIDGLWYWTLAFELTARLMNRLTSSPELNTLMNELPGLVSRGAISGGVQLDSEKLSKGLADLELLRSTAAWMARQSGFVGTIVQDDIPRPDRDLISAELRTRFEPRIRQLLQPAAPGVAGALPPPQTYVRIGRRHSGTYIL